MDPTPTQSPEPQPPNPETAPESHRIVLSGRQMVVIEQHATRAYPEECCGFLLGGETEPGRTVVERVLPAMNERADSRSNRFLIRPETVLAAHREADAAGLDVVGYYHSHPDHPAEPSEFDREHAWPGLSYLIVPVAEGRPGTARSWRLTDDRESFDEEAVERAEARAAALLARRDRDPRHHRNHRHHRQQETD